MRSTAPWVKISGLIGSVSVPTIEIFLHFVELVALEPRRGLYPCRYFLGEWNFLF